MFAVMDVIERDKIMVSKMIIIYCRNKHAFTGQLCEECKAMENYAYQRLDKCRFGNDKPTCEKCPIHCYKPDLRKKMQEIMRYSGPRMIIYHPVSAFRHLMHSMKKNPLRRMLG